MSLDAPIIVTGMHRSGMSATANILQALGVYLGNPEHLFQGDRNNPKGHFEHQAAVIVNDRLLEEVGAAWDLPPLRRLVPADVGTELISSVRRSVAGL